LKIFLVFLILTGVVFADRNGGPYIGIGYGDSTYNDDGLYANVKSDKSASAVVYAGAYINKHLSVELDYASFDAWQKEVGYRIDDTKEISYSAITANVLAHYAFFDDILDFYARGGVGQIDTSGISASGFTIVYGGGIELRVNEWFGIRTAYDRHAFQYKDTADKAYDMYIDFIYGAIEFQF